MDSSEGKKISTKDILLAAWKSSGPLPLDPMFFMSDYISKDQKTNENTDNNQSKSVQKEQFDLMSPEVSSFVKEVAIAQRINNSDEVTIEEYYENSGEGSGGLGVDKNGAKAGVKGSSGRITKRVYTFKGLDKSIENIIDVLNEDREKEETKTSEEDQ